MLIFSGLDQYGEAVIYEYIIGTIDPEINPMQDY